MPSELYYVAVKADDAWQAELVKQFGKHAGDVRYTKEGEGLEGSELRRLYEQAKQACSVWLRDMRKG